MLNNGFKASIALADVNKFSSICLKSAVLLLQISENKLKPPQNQFTRQIKVKQWMTTRGSYVYKPMVTIFRDIPKI